jgi:UDP-4-amino-4,6-dideoxy-N-acetyl-beta-L-altrosamine N-acetyltransferase
MLEWRNSPSVRANMYTRHEISREEHYRWWGQTVISDAKLYLMYERNSVPLGIVGITQIDRVNVNASWDFYTSPNPPLGTGSRMEFLALDHVFRMLRMHKLYCEVLAFNMSVIRLHQKFGFQIEGTFRQQYRTDMGYVDIFRLGILSEEWQLQRPTILKILSRNQKT